MRDVLLSRFTPSLLSAEALEHLFVQRSRLAATVVSGIRESCLTASRHYYLVTGPRGIGKTHLVSLVYHRLRADPDLRGRMRIAWLREEEWGVASYLDLLLAIVRAIQEGEPDADVAGGLEELRRKPDEASAEEASERAILAAAGDGTLLVIAENLDEIFRGLGTEGQERLRALVQNHPVFTILGTAQSLFDAVTSRAEPFYGFFEPHQLDELTFESAVELVARIAERDEDAGLKALLDEPLGRARMRVVHHLAAGNPRVYVIFSQFLTAGSLDELVTPLLQALDDLTPYYQGRMAHLSPQQRKLVEHLSERRGGVPVKEIAGATFMTPQTASAQLRRLDELGYVLASSVGRHTYYELREPLLRLTLEVKRARGGPVRLVVEFLRLWYSATELEARLTPGCTPGERAYLQAALELQRREGVDVVRAVCRADLERFLEGGAWSQAYAVAEELLAVGATGEDYDRILALPGAPDRQVAEALLGKADESYRAGRLEDALAALDELAARFAESDDPPLWTRARAAPCVRGLVLSALGRSEEAVASYDQVVRDLGDSGEAPWRCVVATSLFAKGQALGKLGRRDEELSSYDEVVRRCDGQAPPALAWYLGRALHEKGLVLAWLGRLDESIVVADEVGRRFGEVEDPALLDLVASALLWKGIWLDARDRTEEAIAAFDEGLRRSEGSEDEGLREQVGRVSLSHGVALARVGRVEAAKLALSRAAPELAHPRGSGGASPGFIAAWLAARTKDAATWRRVVPLLVDTFRTGGCLGDLGVGLVQSIAYFADAERDYASMPQWLAVWADASAGAPELEVALRILRAAVDHLVAGDRAALQRLAAEERDVLLGVLGVLGDRGGQGVAPQPR